MWAGGGAQLASRPSASERKSRSADTWVEDIQMDMARIAGPVVENAGVFVRGNDTYLVTLKFGAAFQHFKSLKRWRARQNESDNSYVTEIPLARPVPPA